MAFILCNYTSGSNVIYNRRMWKGFSLELNLCLWLSGALLPALQWLRGPLCFAAVVATAMLLDLRTLVSHTDVWGWELLKSLQRRCRVTGWKWILTMLNLYYFFWFFLPVACGVGHPERPSKWPVLHASLDLLRHTLCLCDSALKEMMRVSTYFRR